MAVRIFHPEPGLAALLLLAACGPGETPPSPLTSGPAPIFEDVTRRVGLDFVHDSGAKGDYVMWEQMASGVALLDFNQDGHLDLYFVQCGGPGSNSPNRLFQQQPDGRFQDVSKGSGLDVTGWGMGAFAGDLNNDSFPDLVLTEYGATRVFLNQGGTRFDEITRSAGIDNPRWATAAAFIDYDRDQWLDLVVVNYLDYDPGRKCRDHTGAREYCGPQDFPGTASRLYRHLGPQPDGVVRFEDVTVGSGIARTPGPGLGLLCADLTGDGWPDIFIADDGKPNRLFVNRGDGTFEDEAARRGIAYNAMGAPAGNMGVGVGDVNADGLLDVFVTHLTHEQHSLWIQGPSGLFQDRVSDAGLVNPAWRGTGFGTFFADLDLDGSQDLAFVNGRVLRGQDPGDRLPGLHPLWHPYAQRSQLFLNDGSGKFRDVSPFNPDFCHHAQVGRGLAMGDLDNDGDVDAVVTSTGGPARMFFNVAPRRGHWLTVRALDPDAGGRDAIGAKIRVVTPAATRPGLVQPSSSFLSSHDPRVPFGLGPSATYDALHIRWPDGTAEAFNGGSADAHVVIRKGTGRRISPTPTSDPTGSTLPPGPATNATSEAPRLR